jgi:hypothetical protein
MSLSEFEAAMAAGLLAGRLRQIESERYVADMVQLRSNGPVGADPWLFPSSTLCRPNPNWASLYREPANRERDFLVLRYCP